MQIVPKIFLFFLFAAAAACSSTGTTNSNQTKQSANSANTNSVSVVKDDIDGLELTIRLPFHPEEAVWREDAAASGKKLTAIMRFLKEDAEKLSAQAQNYRPPQPETLTTENWFPGELTAQSHTSGDETLKGQSYAANDFYNAPYAEGKLTRIDGTNYFILELFAK